MSAYDMISSFIDVYLELNGFILDKSRKSLLASIDFDETLAFAEYLKNFVDVTDLLSAEKTPTIQLVLPFEQRLIQLSKPDPKDPDSIAKFKKYFENEIPTYWELDDVHYVAAVLHPRFKHLQNCSNKEKKKAYELLQKEINKRYGSETAISIDSHTSPQPKSSSTQDRVDFLSQCFDQTPTLTTAANPPDELRRYLLSNDSLENDENLLIFWKRQKVLYPTLYSRACEILVIPATNTAVERLFPASGNTITNTRTRLSAEKVGKLMFIKKKLPILKKIFVKNEKLNNLNTPCDTIINKGKKRSYDNDDDDIFLTDANDDE